MRHHPLPALAAASALAIAALAPHSGAEDGPKTPPAYPAAALDLPADLPGELTVIDAAFPAPGRMWLLLSDGRILARQEATPEAPEPRYWWFSEHGLDRPGGLVASAANAALVTQATELSEIFDISGDGTADFYKSVLPVWRLAGSLPLPRFSGPPVRLLDGVRHLVLESAAKEGQAPPRTVYRLPVEGDVFTWAIPPAGAPGFAPGTFETPWIAAARLPNSPGNGALFVIEAPAPAIEAAKAGPPAPETSESPKSEKPAEDAPKPPPPPPPPPMPAAEPVVWLPASAMGETSGLPIWNAPVVDEGFGPFSEQIFLGGPTTKGLWRVLPDRRVAGHLQGAVTDFPVTGDAGLSFVRFDAAGGTLLAGSDRDLRRVTHEAAGTHFAVREIRIASDGFEIVLTEPVDRVPALVADRYRVGQFAFPDGDPTRATAVAPERVTIEPDGKTLALRLPDLDAGRVYAFDLGELRSETGAPLAHGPVYYSVRSLAPSVAEPAPPGGEKADTGEASDPKADPVETREAR